ncbi:MAG: hydrogenase expression/formation protein HypE [Gammaproteobacteria bacterium]|nr:hydrogenase expression/formation protein HypE [Gammaproteobacteria bacterium]
MSNTITLSHGNGGKYMRRLIEDVFSKHLSNDLLNTESDAALLPMQNQPLMTTVDGFTVQPIIFPGGNIGSLCIHGTVNDLAVSGAIPKFITLGVIIEEGLSFEILDKVVKTMAEAAKEAGVKIVCGDTKVVPRGQGSEVYFTTTGIGYKTSVVDYSTKLIKPGDKILISGSIGDHGAAIMLAREQFGLSGNLKSDSANVISFCQSVYDLEGVRFMRDPTRGGIASVLHEINQATGYGIQMNEVDAPIHDEVITICDMLGYEPYYLANEGRVVAVVDSGIAEQVLTLWKNIDHGENAAIIGEVTDQHQQVVLQTELGGERIMHELSDTPLPRIC